MNVRIERLDPMRVAWVRVVAPNPEQQAWSRLRRWAEPRGLLAQSERHPVFGFNNPPPARGSAEYGYEMWIAAAGDPAEGVGFKDFPGGLYATTSSALADVPATWKALLRWVSGSQYAWRRSTHELERIRNPLAPERDLVLDLYLPIEGE